MATRIPDIDIDGWEITLLCQQLTPARTQSAPWVIKLGTAVIRSCSGKSTFPSKGAAVCALSHTIARAVRYRTELTDLVQRTRAAAVAVGRYGHRNWSLLVAKKLIDRGFISVVRADGQS